MKKISLCYLILFLMASSMSVMGGNKITFDDVVVNHTFGVKGISGLRSMNDGLHYTAIGSKGTEIIQYSYKTGQKVKTIVDIKNLKIDSLTSISNYQFSDSENKILLETDPQYIYRRSYTAQFYVYDIDKNKIEPLSLKGRQQVATFSPNGERVAFVRKNNIYIKSLRFGTEHQVTSDGKFNHIINGVPDWVYEEEFEFNKAIYWSPNSEKLAYLRFDESAVKTFGFTMFKGSAPIYSENKLYPSEYSYKYPKAGETNSIVSVHVYDVKQKQSVTMDIGNETDQYIPRLRWTYSGNDLAIFRVNRLQNQWEVLYANPFTGDSRIVFTEKNKRYIDEGSYDNFVFLQDGKHFVVASERDGYMHLYLYNNNGTLVKQLTKGEYDVTAFYGYDIKRHLFYYQAARVSPMNREVYYLSLDGKKKGTLMGGDGTNSVSFGKGFLYYIGSFENIKTPKQIKLYSYKGKVIRTLEDNKALEDKLATYDVPNKEFFSFKTSEGVQLNGYMIKPRNFDPNKKYPVLMTQYSGPNSQQVLNVFGISWYDYLATEGYVVACVDPRGTGARGEEFRKCTYGNMGDLESKDQIEAGKYLGSLPYVDQSSIAIWGWSYGGFMSTLCLSKGADVFKAAIAVAPVTNWRFYDSIYTERYMGLPQDNPEGYDSNSPITHAPKIKGKFLLVHGLADDNVHFQNTAELSEVLVQSGVQVQMMTYTNRNHSIYGGNTRKHLYTLFTNFLNDNLK